MLSLFVVLTVLASIHGAPNVEPNSSDEDLRILKGENATIEEFPFMVSLRRIQTYRHYCAGTILTSNWVMTAAHCCLLDWRSSFHTATVVRAGSTYFDHGGMNHTVVRVHPHPDSSFFPRIVYDICVIRVSNPFKFGKFVQPVVLPKKDFVVHSGDKLTAVGWGLIGSRVLPVKLQKLTKLIGITNEECQIETRTNVSDDFICARAQHSGQGICFGDSGGALLKGDVQVGVSSHIFRPCGNPAPDFYGRVSYVVDWIKEKLGPEAADLKFSD